MKVNEIMEKKQITLDDRKLLVAHCKGLVNERVKIKDEIVKICIKVCSDAKYHNSVKVYTLAEFASDIGVKYKTLWRWRKEYLLVKSKAHKEDLKGLSRRQFEKVFSAVDENTSKSDVRKMIKDVKAESKENRILRDYIYKLSNLDFFLNHSVILTSLDSDLMEAVEAHTSSILRAVENYKNKDNSHLILKQKTREAVRAFRESRKHKGEFCYE